MARLRRRPTADFNEGLALLYEGKSWAERRGKHSAEFDVRRIPAGEIEDRWGRPLKGKKPQKVAVFGHDRVGTAFGVLEQGLVFEREHPKVNQ